MSPLSPPFIVVGNSASGGGGLSYVAGDSSACQHPTAAPTPSVSLYSPSPATPMYAVGSSSSSVAAATTHAPTPVSALLMVAASPPLGAMAAGAGGSHGRNLSADSPSMMSMQMQMPEPIDAEEQKMLAALSSALHADEAQNRAALAQQRMQDAIQQQQVLSKAIAQPPQRRILVTLPPAQLHSLVRSHLRQVTRTARLKTKHNAR